MSRRAVGPMSIVLVALLLLTSGSPVRALGRLPDAPAPLSSVMPSGLGTAGDAVPIAHEAPPYDCPGMDPVEALAPVCPVRLRVEGQVLGRPVMAMSPADPRHLALVALGGTPAGAPTPSSRANASVAVFLSSDGGGSFQALLLPPPEQGLLGEEVAVAMDARGNLVVAALFTRPGAVGPSVLAAWKPGPLDAALGGGWPEPQVFAPWAKAATMPHMDLLSVPGHGVVLLWEEVGVAPDARAPLGPVGFVRHARSLGEPAAPWDVVPDTSVLGPCRGLTNAVAVEDQAYFGCTAETGLWPERNVTAGMLVFHALDAADGAVAYRSKVPLQGDALLFPLAHGRVGLVVTEVLGPTEVRVVYTNGLKAMNWTGPRRLGEDLHNITNDPAVREARALGVGAHATSGLVWMLYGEVPEAAPEGPLAALEPRQAKWLVGFSAVGAFQFKETLDVDNATARLLRDPGRRALDAPFPEDPRDAVLAYGTRNFIAYADAGEVVVSELVGPTLPLQQPPRPEKISDVPTALSNEPPRPFTPAFIVLGVALAAGMLLRVLYGRVEVRVRLDEPQRR